MLFDSRRRRAGREAGGLTARSPSSPLARWTLLVVRFRGPVLAAWLLLLATGISLSLFLPAHLSTSFAVPGTDSARADAALTRGFGERAEGTFTVVFRVRHASDSRVQHRLRARLEHAAQTLPAAGSACSEAGSASSTASSRPA